MISKKPMEERFKRSSRRMANLNFRSLEHHALTARVRDVERGKPCVIALGGGTLRLRSDNYALLENHGITLWLDAPTLPN